jgi:hypothetical protein
MGEAARPPKARPDKPIFRAREGFDTDFRDIKLPPEPTLGIDEALGVRWERIRGKISGIRYGTLRQRRAIEKQLELVAENSQTAEDPEEAQYQASIRVFQQLLVLPDVDSPDGVRVMELSEIEDRLDIVDFGPLTQLAFPSVSPLQKLLPGNDVPND